LIFHLTVRKKREKGCAENKIAFIDNINIMHLLRWTKDRKDLFDINRSGTANDAYAVYYLKTAAV